MRFMSGNTGVIILMLENKSLHKIYAGKQRSGCVRFMLENRSLYEIYYGKQRYGCIRFMLENGSLHEIYARKQRDYISFIRFFILRLDYLS